MIQEKRKKTKRDREREKREREGEKERELKEQINIKRDKSAKVFYKMKVGIYFSLKTIQFELKH